MSMGIRLARTFRLRQSDSFRKRLDSNASIVVGEESLHIRVQRSSSRNEQGSSRSKQSNHPRSAQKKSLTGHLDQHSMPSESPEDAKQDFSKMNLATMNPETDFFSHVSVALVVSPKLLNIRTCRNANIETRLSCSDSK
jgi:hypothetical protein